MQLDLPVYSGERFPSQYYNYSYNVCQGWIYNWDYGTDFVARYSALLELLTHGARTQ